MILCPDSTEVLVKPLFRWATAALRKMYKILLGHMEPPDDVTPDFIDEGMTGVGSRAQQALERLNLLRVGLLCICVHVLCMHAVISQTCCVKVVSLFAQNHAPTSPGQQACIWYVI